METHESIDVANDALRRRRPIEPTAVELVAAPEASEVFDAETASPRTNPRRLRRFLIASDVVAVTGGFVVATAVRQLLRTIPHDALMAEALLGLLIVPMWIVMMGANELFLARAISRFGEEVRRIVLASATSVGLLIAVSFVAKYDVLSRLWVGLMFVGVTGSLVASRLVARQIFGRLRRQGRISRPVVIVGTGTDAISLLHAMQRRPDLGYEVLGFTGDPDGERGGLGVLGSVGDTPDVVRATGATGVILSVASLDPAEVNRLTRVLTEDGCHVTLSSSLHDIDISRTRSQAIDGRLMIYVEPTNRSRPRLFLKRCFDVSLAGVVGLVTLPIVVVAAMAIKVTSPGPVLFMQVRVGKDGVPFEILKLRTMVVGAEAMRADLEGQNESSGPLFKMRADPRVTRVGRFLRKTSIDELPQLWNVVRGDMSVVGPRPALPAEAEQWSPELRNRLRVLPGITGMWQVSGRSQANFDLYRRLDLYYVDNWSLAHDVRIVLKTVVVVLAGRGAH